MVFVDTIQQKTKIINLQNLHQNFDSTLFEQIEFDPNGNTSFYKILNISDKKVLDNIFPKELTDTLSEIPESVFMFNYGCNEFKSLKGSYRLKKILIYFLGCLCDPKNAKEKIGKKNFFTLKIDFF